MIIVPEKLLNLPNITRIIDNGRSFILRKQLSEPVLERESYVSRHAISVVVNGEQRIHSFDGEMMVIRKNQLAFIPKGLYVVSDLMPTSGQFESILFYLEDEILREFQQNQDHVKPLDLGEKEVSSFFTTNYPASFLPYLESFFRFLADFSSTDEHIINTKLTEILWLIKSMEGGEIFTEYLTMIHSSKRKNIKSFMEAHFNKPLKIEDYAYLSGRSLSSFRRDFKTYFSIPPQQWLKRKRLEKAFQILSLKQMSVAEVSREVGYENTSYFIQAFKEKYRLTPKQMMLQGKESYK